MSLPDDSKTITKRALLWMNLSGEPFVALYALLPFILRKDLHAALWHISLLTMLRPILPLFSMYWSIHLPYKKLRTNLMGAWILARAPFLLIPWIPSITYVILCCAFYELFHKSSIPALTEFLKVHLPSKTRERAFTFSFVLSFVESIILGFILAFLLDKEHSWKILCAITACFSLTSLLWQRKLPLPPVDPSKVATSTFSWLAPWKEALDLFRNHPDFARFQKGFMIGGFGLMLLAPSLPIFCADELQLSYAPFTMGRSICMGLGVVLSSYFWQKTLSPLSIDHLTRTILLGFALFPLTLLLGSLHLAWFYIAFVIYGIAQAGSHLLWNLSSTFFAKGDSTPFSRTNILMVGIRGLIAPALGALLCAYFGPKIPLLFGSLTCLYGVFYITKAIANKLITTHSKER